MCVHVHNIVLLSIPKQPSYEKGMAPKRARVKKDVKSRVAATAMMLMPIIL